MPRTLLKLASLARKGRAFFIDPDQAMRMPPTPRHPPLSVPAPCTHSYIPLSLRSPLAPTRDAPFRHSFAPLHSGHLGPVPFPRPLSLIKPRPKGKVAAPKDSVNKQNDRIRRYFEATASNYRSATLLTESIQRLVNTRQHPLKQSAVA